MKNTDNKLSPRDTLGDKCGSCAFYDIDDEGAGYVCTMNLDEDELFRFVRGDTSRCPYFRPYDEYAIARRQ